MSVTGICYGCFAEDAFAGVLLSFYPRIGFLSASLCLEFQTRQQLPRSPLLNGASKSTVLLLPRDFCDKLRSLSAALHFLSPIHEYVSGFYISPQPHIFRLQLLHAWLGMRSYFTYALADSEQIVYGSVFEAISCEGASCKVMWHGA